MKTLEDKAAVAAQLSKGIFNQFKELPPNVMLFKEDGVYNLFFDEMQTPQHKNEIQFITILIAMWLGEVDAIAFNCESWAMQVSEKHTPELWAEFNGQHNKIIDHVLDKYGSVGESPYKVECLTTCIDDGKQGGVSQAQITRFGESIDISKPDFQIGSDAEYKPDPRHKFNALLLKTNAMTAMMTEVLPKLMGKSDVDKLVLTTFKDRFYIDMDVDKVLTKAKRVFKLIQNGRTEVKVH